MITKGHITRFVLIVLSVFLFSIFIYFNIFKTVSEPVRYVAEKESLGNFVPAVENLIPVPEVRVVTHINTPESVKAVYMSSWVAGTPGIRSKLIELIEETELNSVIIDVKDSTGKVAFYIEDPIIQKYDSIERRIRDIENLIDTLHEKNIYVIARICAFQDTHLAETRSDLSPISKNSGKIWRDRKGVAWVDPGSKEVWDYVVAIGKRAYEIGFDELNFDYIRFPSDGNMSDIEYIHYDTEKGTKAEKIKEFFAYLHSNFEPLKIPTSADLFGMTMNNTDDLNIGQVLENALPYFDFIAPMVYPSHYPPGFNGFKNPATVPYEIIKISMDEGVKRVLSASSSPTKLRPWLQDFNMGATYNVDMVRAQIKATYDAGLNSWMLWDPSNKYTRGALIGSDELTEGN